MQAEGNDVFPFCWSSSTSGIDLPGLFYNRVAEVFAQISMGIQIDLATEDNGQFILKSDKSKSRRTAWMKFHQNIQVAVPLLLATIHRAENREFANVVSFANISKSVIGFLVKRFHCCKLAICTKKVHQSMELLSLLYTCRAPPKFRAPACGQAFNSAFTQSHKWNCCSKKRPSRGVKDYNAIRPDCTVLIVITHLPFMRP